jgi:cell division protein FtsB
MLTKISRNKKKINNIFSTVFYICLMMAVLLVMVLLVIGNVRINQKRNELNSEIDSLKVQVQKLREQEELFKSQILGTDENEYLEQKARDIFDLKKEGEKAVIIK